MYWRGRPRLTTAEVEAADDIDASSTAMFLGVERSRSGSPHLWQRLRHESGGRARAILGTPAPFEGASLWGGIP